jgi:late competence protein required for DNA uptake (superfamily II DNA/RNA helicase)
MIDLAYQAVYCHYCIMLARVAKTGLFMYNDSAVCPGGLKDKVTVSGTVDTGSIPVRDAMKPRNPFELLRSSSRMRGFSL